MEKIRDISASGDIQTTAIGKEKSNVE